MNIWITSDTHFLHERVFDNRTKLMQHKLWEQMLAVPKEDVILVLGDICVGRNEEVHEKFIKPLKARMWLIIGNHDNKPIHWYLDNGWDFAAHEILIKRFGEKMLFTHIPVAVERKCTINIHGHIHSEMRRKEFEKYQGDATHKFLNITPESVGGLINLEYIPKLVNKK